LGEGEGEGSNGWTFTRSFTHFLNATKQIFLFIYQIIWDWHKCNSRVKARWRIKQVNLHQILHPISYCNNKYCLYTTLLLYRDNLRKIINVTVGWRIKRVKVHPFDPSPDFLMKFLSIYSTIDTIIHMCCLYVYNYFNSHCVGCIIHPTPYTRAPDRERMEILKPLLFYTWVERVFVTITTILYTYIYIWD